MAATAASSSSFLCPANLEGTAEKGPKEYSFSKVNQVWGGVVWGAGAGGAGVGGRV